MNTKVCRFCVSLMNLNGVIYHIVNCVDELSAKLISENLYKGYRVIDIVKEM